MAVISFRCGACKQVLRVAADKAGRKAKCTKCGKEVTIPAAAPQPAEKSAPAAAAATTAAPPAADPAPAKKLYSDDQDDDGGAYTFLDEPKPVEEEVKKKKRRTDDDDDEDEDDLEEPEEKELVKKASEIKTIIPRKKIKKKKVQFAHDWDKFRVALALVFSGMCGWLLVWVMHTVIVLLGILDHPAYGEVVDRVAQGGVVDMPALGVGLLTGSNADVGKVLLLIEQIIIVISGVAFLGAYCVCLAVPNRFGTKGQALTLIIVGGVNLVLDVVLRLLPMLGAINYVLIPLMAPEAAFNEANIDRVLAIHAFWCYSPFWEYLGTIVVQMLFFAEPVLFAVFMRAAALAMTDDEWLEPRALFLQRAGLCQFFVLVAYYLLSITGSSAVLRIVLFVVYGMWRAFFLGYMIWYAIITWKARKRVEDVLGLDEAEDEAQDEDEDEEEEDEDEEDEDEEEE